MCVFDECATKTNRQIEQKSFKGQIKFVQMFSLCDEIESHHIDFDSLFNQYLLIGSNESTLRWTLKYLHWFFIIHIFSLLE